MSLEASKLGHQKVAEMPERYDYVSIGRLRGNCMPFDAADAMERVVDHVTGGTGQLFEAMTLDVAADIRVDTAWKDIRKTSDFTATDSRLLFVYFTWPDRVGRQCVSIEQTKNLIAIGLSLAGRTMDQEGNDYGLLSTMSHFCCNTYSQFVLGAGPELDLANCRQLNDLDHVAAAMEADGLCWHLTRYRDFLGRRELQEYHGLPYE